MGFRVRGGGGGGGAAAIIINFAARLVGGFKQFTRLILVEGNKVSAGFFAVFSPFRVTSTQEPAIKVEETTITVLHQSYVSTATESAGSDWDTIAESEDAEDSVYSELVEGLVLTQGTLIGAFPAQVSRDPLAISKVVLRPYYQVGNFLLIGTTLTLSYRVGTLGTPVQLAQHVGGVVTPTNVNRLSGFAFDITSSGPDGIGGAWTWSDLTDLQIEFNGTILVDTGLSIVRVDATRLEVEASHTEAA